MTTKAPAQIWRSVSKAKLLRARLALPPLSLMQHQRLPARRYLSSHNHAVEFL